MNEQKIIIDLFNNLADNTKSLTESVNKQSDLFLIMRISLDLIKLRLLIDSLIKDKDNV